MNDFVFPGLNDLRAELPRANWEIGRRTETRYITLHYNGPAVPVLRQSGAGLMVQLRADCAWQMRPGWGTTVNGADGLQYHFVVDASGVVHQTRDLNASLWHCGHRVGNPQSLALHLPLGVGQDATEIQWSAALGLVGALRSVYGISYTNVLGHQEWKSTACPGPFLMARLLRWRASAPALPVAPLPTGARLFRVVSPDKLNVRFGPGMSFGVAGTLGRGREVWIDTITNGWAHMALVPHEQGDLGFVAARYLEVA